MKLWLKFFCFEHFYLTILANSEELLRLIEENSGDPNQTAHLRSLIWDCTVFRDLYVTELQLLSKVQISKPFDCLFGLRFYIPVNSYGHVETVSSSNHTFSSVSLT